MALIDLQYLETAFYGRWRITTFLRYMGYGVNRVYLYFIFIVEIIYVNYVCNSYTTYFKLKRGFMYLTAVID